MGMRFERKGPLSVLMGVPKQGIPGGPQGHLPFLVEGLRERGVEVREEVYGNPFGNIGTRRRAALVLSAAWRLRSAQQDGHFAVVHLNTAFDTNALLRDVAVTALLRRDRGRLFLKFHGSVPTLLSTRNPILRMLVRRLLARADAIGVLSKEERDNFLAAGLDPGKVTVVKNILRPELYTPDPGFRRAERLPAEVPVILFAARFVREKGAHDVIEACARVRAGGQRFVLLMAGDGPVRREAEDDVRRLDLEDTVRFTGQIPEERMRTLYANATMLAFPTYDTEGFPMVVFQSVAAGLPVITTRIRGSAHYLREPENCLWVEPRNAGQLAEKIIFLLQHPEARRRMSECNRLLAGQFGSGVVTEEYLQLYEQLIKRAERRRS